MGGGEGVEDWEDWGLSEAVTGAEPDSDSGAVWDGPLSESHW